MLSIATANLVLKHYQSANVANFIVRYISLVLCVIQHVIVCSSGKSVSDKVISICATRSPNARHYSLHFPLGNTQKCEFIVKNSSVTHSDLPATVKRTHQLQN